MNNLVGPSRPLIMFRRDIIVVSFHILTRTKPQGTTRISPERCPNLMKEFES
jgi:hypothetical protein